MPERGGAPEVMVRVARWRARVWSSNAAGRANSAFHSREKCHRRRLGQGADRRVLPQRWVPARFDRRRLGCAVSPKRSSAVRRGRHGVRRASGCRDPHADRACRAGRRGSAARRKRTPYRSDAAGGFRHGHTRLLAWASHGISRHCGTSCSKPRRSSCRQQSTCIHGSRPTAGSWQLDKIPDANRTSDCMTCPSRPRSGGSHSGATIAFRCGRAMDDA